MIKEYQTRLGKIIVGTPEDVARENLECMSALAEGATVGLTGGSTPKSVYRMASENAARWKAKFRRLNWFCSDERYVPLASDESNFGNALRLMLDPLEVPKACRHPWPVALSPDEAAQEFERRWKEQFGSERCFDLCLLGMGEDCHTLSLFPGSELLKHPVDNWFASVNVPGKGWRLTLTPVGLKHCGRVTISAVGSGKVDALRQVFGEPTDISKRPVQLLESLAGRVTWLMDEAAAEGLDVL